MWAKLRRGDTIGQALGLLVADLIIGGALAAATAHAAFLIVTIAGSPYFPSNPHPSVERLRALFEAGDWRTLALGRSYEWVAIPWALMLVAGARLLGLSFKIFVALVLAVFALSGFVIVGMGMDCCGNRFSTLNVSLGAFLASGIGFALVFWLSAHCMDLARGAEQPRGQHTET